MKLPLISIDKANHIVYGAVIASATAFASSIITELNTGLVSMAAVIVFALGKEAFDYTKNVRAKKKNLRITHGVEVWDFIATIVGGLLVNILNF